MNQYIQKLYLILLLPLLNSCGNSALNNTFDKDRYELDFSIIQRQEKISRSEIFLLNYAVIRQNDYFNYGIEGKTYKEILELAKALKMDGMAFEEKFISNGSQDGIKSSLLNEGNGFVRKKEGSKRLIKMMKFRGEFTNIMDKDLVLLNSTIQLKGPFKKHITSAGYELNCLLKPGGTLQVDFVLDAKNIQRNILFHNNYATPTFFIDSLIANSSLLLTGNSTTTNTEFFESCDFDGTRIKPFKYYEYKEDFDPAKQIVRAGSKTTKINYGDAHFIIKENDDIINYR